MIKHFYFLVVIGVFISGGVAQAEERFGDLIQCPEEQIIKMEDFSGQTFLSFMETTVKPELDYYADEGYEIAPLDRILGTLDVVAPKVSKKALSSGKGIEGLTALSEALSQQTVNLYNLPDRISEVSKAYRRYPLSTYIGLASCGGAIVKVYDDNYAYNIHYGTGTVDKDNRTGRSFGAGPGRMANDASDKAYLTDLEEYVLHDKGNIEAFFENLLKAVTDSDTSKYGEITDLGQAVLTDFLAVYVAEQDRNLMDGKVHPHWDAALLEVTLLSAFHSGQDTLALYYNNPVTEQASFTEAVLNQKPGCESNSAEQRKLRAAHLKDYWQFSSSVDPEHCRRSGINITKKQFRTLGERITDYETRNHPEMVAELQMLLKSSKRLKRPNLFYDLSRFLINPKTEKQLGATGDVITKAFVAFLMQVQSDAKAISAEINDASLR